MLPLSFCSLGVLSTNDLSVSAGILLPGTVPMGENRGDAGGGIRLLEDKEAAAGLLAESVTVVALGSSCFGLVDVDHGDDLFFADDGPKRELASLPLANRLE